MRLHSCCRLDVANDIVGKESSPINTHLMLIIILCSYTYKRAAQPYLGNVVGEWFKRTFHNIGTTVSPTHLLVSYSNSVTRYDRVVKSATVQDMPTATEIAQLAVLTAIHEFYKHSSVDAIDSQEDIQGCHLLSYTHLVAVICTQTLIVSLLLRRLVLRNSGPHLKKMSSCVCTLT